mgnify:CR=1 FL=1
MIYVTLFSALVEKSGQRFYIKRVSVDKNRGNKRKTELLAPAGSLETAIAAFQSGADAVYLGMDKYNARIPAENFGFDEVSKLAAYAKKHGKKYYLTLNTLLKDGELPDAARMLAEVEELEPDAVIVQDIGVLRLIREFFPRIPIHASTQMGIHNSAGVQLAERLGIERVILERQVSLDELRSIARAATVELEVFVHGALCCSLSGRCLFSSWIGGWSGNRGRCKQPCRRRYYYGKKGSQKAGFLFSTQDLYSLDLIPQLVDIGVSSLKIEGRLKKANYVQSVVSAYRMVLDSSEDKLPTVLKQAKQVLSDSYGRRWSHGFATAEDMETVVQPESLGVSGMLVGKVLGKNGRRLRASLNRRLYLGDRVRVQSTDGGESPSITITSLYQHGKKVRTASKGEVEIPSDREFSEKGMLYKVGRIVKRSGPGIEDLPHFQSERSLSLTVTVRAGRLDLSLRRGEETIVDWQREIESQEAKKRALDRQALEGVFGATGIDGVRLYQLNVDVEAGLFVPLSHLKELRREFWVHARALIPEDGPEEDRRRREQELAGRISALFDGMAAQAPQGRKANELSCAGSKKKRGDCGIKVDELYSFDRTTDEVELPHFIAEGALDTVRKKIDLALQSGIRRFRITDLSNLSLLREHSDYFKELIISSSYPLPVCNSLAALELKDLGLSKVQAWIELDRPAVLSLRQHSPVPVELFSYGRPFILATRAKIAAAGRINDPRGRNFLLEYSGTDKITYLYPYEVLELPSTRDGHEFRDFRHLGEVEKQTSSFNFETEFI